MIGNAIPHRPSTTPLQTHLQVHEKEPGFAARDLLQSAHSLRLAPNACKPPADCIAAISPVAGTHQWRVPTSGAALVAWGPVVALLGSNLLPICGLSIRIFGCFCFSSSLVFVGGRDSFDFRTSKDIMQKPKLPIKQLVILGMWSSLLTVKGE